MYTRVQLVLTEDLHARLRRLARERGKSMSAVVREILERQLAAEEEQRRERRRKILARLSEASENLERAGGRPMTGEEIVEMIRKMREERTDEIVRHVLGS